MKLDEAKEGMRVGYKPWPAAPADQWEYGRISSFNHRYIFVRFSDEIRGKACAPEDLFNAEPIPSL